MIPDSSTSSTILKMIYYYVPEEKLRKIRSDPDVLKQLAAKREACMQQLLLADAHYDSEETLELDAPVTTSHIVRALYPERQAISQGEVVELVKYDQLTNDDDDSENDGSVSVAEAEDNRSP